MRKFFRKLVDLGILVWKGVRLAFSTLFLYLRFRFLKWRKGRAFRRTLEDQGMEERRIEELNKNLDDFDLKDLF